MCIMNQHDEGTTDLDELLREAETSFPETPTSQIGPVLRVWLGIIARNPRLTVDLDFGPLGERADIPVSCLQCREIHCYSEYTPNESVLVDAWNAYLDHGRGLAEAAEIVRMEYELGLGQDYQDLAIDPAFWAHLAN
jgi:hypothetical protein